VKVQDAIALIVAVGILGVLLFLVWALTYVAIPEANSNAVTVLLGAVAANVGAVVNYYFGSSATSKAKDETISNMSSKP
jgi:hypothetical protein